QAKGRSHRSNKVVLAVPMRLFTMPLAVVLTTLMTSLTGAVSAQEAPASAQPSSKPSEQTTAPSSPQDAAQPNLPVSLDRIRKALEQPAQPALKIPDNPTFSIQIQERNRLQDLLSTLDFKGGPVPAGGLYAAEMQRVMFPAVSNPLRQPYAAFSQPELLTILIENLVGKYLIGKAFGAINGAERERAEAAARDEVRQT